MGTVNRTMATIIATITTISRRVKPFLRFTQELSRDRSQSLEHPLARSNEKSSIALWLFQTSKSPGRGKTIPDLAPHGWGAAYGNRSYTKNSTEIKEDAAAQAWKLSIVTDPAPGAYSSDRRLTFPETTIGGKLSTRAATWLHAPDYPGMSEKEIEKLLFESIAARLVRALQPFELDEIDRRAQGDPVLYNALEATGLSQDAIRLVFSGLWSSSPEIKPVFPSMSRGLSALLQRAIR